MQATGVLWGGDARYIVIQFKENCHGVGLMRDKDNNLFFFDPNIGEYQVKDASLETFLKAYEQILAKLLKKERNAIDLVYSFEATLAA